MKENHEILHRKIHVDKCISILEKCVKDNHESIIKHLPCFYNKTDWRYDIDKSLQNMYECNMYYYEELLLKEKGKLEIINWIFKENKRGI